MGRRIRKSASEFRHLDAELRSLLFRWLPGRSQGGEVVGQCEINGCSGYGAPNHIGLESNAWVDLSRALARSLSASVSKLLLVIFLTKVLKPVQNAISTV
jgi:hypothetical protein